MALNLICILMLCFPAQSVSAVPSPVHEDSQGTTTYTDLDMLTTTSSSQAQPAYVMLPTMTTSSSSSVPLNIPKPVFSAPISLSPAPSLESVDSNTSGYGSSPSPYTSEPDSKDRPAYGECSH